MKMRRMGGAAGVCLLATALLTSPAHADQPEVYLGNATASALGISLNGEALTFGVSNVSVDSTLHSVAKGAGDAALTQGATDAQVSGDNQSLSRPSTCATATLPMPGLSIGLACSDSTASVTHGLPAAVSDGSVAGIDLDASQVTNGPLAPVTQPIASAVQQALGTIGGSTRLRRRHHTRRHNTWWP